MILKKIRKSIYIKKNLKVYNCTGSIVRELLARLSLDYDTEELLPS